MMTTMVGASFRPSEARAIVSHLNVGDRLELRADPDNAYDDTAVAVYSENIHIGFIPKDHNADLFSRLIDGEEIEAEIIAFENTLKPILEIE